MCIFQCANRCMPFWDFFQKNLTKHFEPFATSKQRFFSSFTVIRIRRYVHPEFDVIDTWHYARYIAALNWLTCPTVLTPRTRYTCLPAVDFFYVGIKLARKDVPRRSGVGSKSPASGFRTRSDHSAGWSVAISLEGPGHRSRGPSRFKEWPYNRRSVRYILSSFCSPTNSSQSKWFQKVFTFFNIKYLACLDVRLRW